MSEMWRLHMISAWNCEHVLLHICSIMCTANDRGDEAR